MSVSSIEQPIQDRSQNTKGQLYRLALIGLMWSGALSAISVGGWLGYRYYLNRPADPITVRLHTIEPDNVEITITASGTLRLGGEQTLKSPENDATVEQVLVDVRDIVTTGQPLIVLRNRQIEKEVRNQQVTNLKTELDLARQQEKVLEARKKLEAAEARLTESAILLEQGFIAEDDLQDDQDKVDQALSSLKDELVEERKAELDVENGQESLSLLQQQLQDRVVTAPIDGIVLQIDVKAGEGIEIDTRLLALGDPNQEIVELELTTLDAAKVKLNQVARIREIGPDSTVYEGRVINLSPQAAGDNSNNTSARVNAQVLLNEPSRTLIPGSFVSVEVVVDRREDTLVVPTEAIQWSDPEPFVWMQNQQGNAEKRPIVLGLEGLEQVEVISGLGDGDQIALLPPSVSVTSGTPLTTNSSRENQSGNNENGSENRSRPRGRNR